MSLNITCNQSPEQMLLSVNNNAIIPTMIIFWILSIVIFLIVGHLVIDNRAGNHPYRKFYIILASYSIVSLIFVAIIGAMPNTVQVITGWFQTIFNF